MQKRGFPQPGVVNQQECCAFSLITCQQLRHNLKAIWEQLSRMAKSPDNIVYFPYHLIRQQSEQHAIACRHSYRDIALGKREARRITMIEVEVLALDRAITCSSFLAPKAPKQAIQNILIALQTIFAEFKENRSGDCQHRLKHFELHIVRLIKELKLLVNEALYQLQASDS